MVDTTLQMLKSICGDHIKVDVAEQDVPAAEAELQKAGASIVQKMKQSNGLFTVYGFDGFSTSSLSSSSRDISPTRQTVDKAMTSGR